MGRRLVGYLLASLAAALVGAPQSPRRVHAARQVAILGGSSSDVLGRVADVALADNGLVYVLDGADLDVKVFRTDGALVRRIGRSGRGPGEFTRPIALDVDAGTLRVTDQVNGTSRFTLDGRHLETLGQGQYQRVGVALRHGFRLVAETPMPVNAGGGRNDEVMARHLLLVGPAGRVDTVTVIRTDAVLFEFADWPGQPSRVPSGFGDSGAWAVSGDSLVAVADGYSGVISWRRVSPQGLREIRAGTTGRGAAVSDADIAMQTPQIIAATGTMRGGPPRGGRMLERPARWSSVTRAFFTRSGDLWLGAPRARRNLAARTIQIENNVWTVFPGDAGVPYSVQFPSSFRLGAVLDTLAVGTPTAADDPAVLIMTWR